MEAASLAKPPEPGTMKYHPVGKAIGRADAEGPELIEPIDPSIDVEEDPRPAEEGRERRSSSLF